MFGANSPLDDSSDESDADQSDVNESDVQSQRPTGSVDGASGTAGNCSTIHNGLHTTGSQPVHPPGTTFKDITRRHRGIARIHLTRNDTAFNNGHHSSSRGSARRCRWGPRHQPYANREGVGETTDDSSNHGSQVWLILVRSARLVLPTP